MICLLGILGVTYFNIFPDRWGGGSFWRWMPISVIAVCVGVVLIAVSLFIGFVSELNVRFRHKNEKNVV